MEDLPASGLGHWKHALHFPRRRRLLCSTTRAAGAEPQGWF